MNHTSFDNNRRKTLLINPRFQRRFLVNMLILNVAISAVFYAAQTFFFWKANQLGLSIGLPEGHVFFKFINEQQRAMSVISLASIGIVSGLIMLFGLVYSHRIAGPVYRLQKYLKDRIDGRVKGPVSFRDGDYFQELAETVNDFVQFEESKKHSVKKKSA
jgi:hypothetical protein